MDDPHSEYFSKWFLLPSRYSDSDSSSKQVHNGVMNFQNCFLSLSLSSSGNFVFRANSQRTSTSYRREPIRVVFPIDATS